MSATDLLWESGWWESKSRYLFVWDGFLYTLVLIDPSDPQASSTSRNGSCPSFSISTVKLMLSSIPLRWTSRSWTLSFGTAVHVSSTYLFQKGSGASKVAKARSSTSSITRLATDTDTGDPIAVPKTCLYTRPRNERKVALRQNSRKWVSSCGVSAVRSCRVWSASNLLRAIVEARCTGTFVNKETTSKETSTSSLWMDLPWMNLAKSAEFRTLDSVLPISGDRTLDKCFDPSRKPRSMYMNMRTCLRLVF